MEVSLELASQVEKTPDLNILNKKKSAQSRVSGSVLHPKYQLSQSKKWKKKETNQQDISHEATFKPPPESVKEFENIPEVVTLSSQKLVGELKETAKVTSRNKKKLEREKAQREQIPEPTP